MATHRIHLDSPLSAGHLRITGDEAHHAARVKRLAGGDPVEVLDGQGGVGHGTVTGLGKERGQWFLDVTIDHLTRADPPRPVIEVCSAIPKGARFADMLDGLAQVGAASWRPLESHRAVRESWRRERAEAVVREAGKQSGRAWTMTILEPLTLDEALRPEPGTTIILADASGEPHSVGLDRVRLLIGPEGGWTRPELDAAAAAGARTSRFGVHTMRIETAAIAATAIIMASAC